MKARKASNDSTVANTFMIIALCLGIASLAVEVIEGDLDGWKKVDGNPTMKRWREYISDDESVRCAWWEGAPGTNHAAYDAWEFIHLIAGKSQLRLMEVADRKRSRLSRGELTPFCERLADPRRHVWTFPPMHVLGRDFRELLHHGSDRVL